jgi:hypothetical protein
VFLGDPGTGKTWDIAFDNAIASTFSDVTPPASPSGVAATPIGANHINVTWAPSTDNVAVAGYTIYRNGAALVTVGGATLGYADTNVSLSTTYTYAVEAFDPAGNRSVKSSAVSATTPPASSMDPVIAAAGDIACDPSNVAFNGGNGTATACQQMFTSNALFSADLAAILPLGDIQYESGSSDAFLASFDPSWGRVKPLLRPVPGNHDYQTPGAAGYYAYFGSAAGVPSKGYYSYDVGAWHLIALNSECGYVGGCGSGSPEEQWLSADLATHQNTCTLAYWHEPRFSSGQNGDYIGNTQAFWEDLYSAGVDVILNGHDHLYERFAPQDTDGFATPDGIREFIVGSGGRSHEGISSIQPNSEVRNADTFGVLELTLHPTAYDWAFVPVAGGTFTDSGTTACH